jgi:hypothetical protein
MLIFLFIVEASIQETKANPGGYTTYNRHVTVVSPPSDMQGPIVYINTPQNGSYYPRNNVTLTGNITLPSPDGNKPTINKIEELYYTVSWEPGETHFSVYGNGSFTFNLFAYGGNHSISIYVDGICDYLNREEKSGKFPYDTVDYYIDRFELANSSTVNFIQDFGPPRISVLSPQNSTYDTSDVDLSLAANEALSQTLYCLDGKENETLTQNMTLTDLTNGTHAITLYAADLAGNKAIPQTVNFNINVKPEPVPFPTATVIAILTVTLTAVFISSFALYRRQRKTTNLNQGKHANSKEIEKIVQKQRDASYC